MSQEVEVKIKVDTGQAVNSVNKLGDSFDKSSIEAKDAQKVFSKAGNGVEVEQSLAGLRQLKLALKNTAVGSVEFKKLYNDIDDLEDKLKSAKNVSSDWVDSLAQSSGPLGMVGQGINSVKVATQSFGGALKATGIGIIVALLGGLMSAFSGNENAMKKIQPLFDALKKITFGIFRAVEPLVDVFMDLAMKAMPYVTDAIGMVYSAMTAYFTLIKEVGGGVMDIIEGIFTLDADKVTSGLDKVSGSFGKAGDTFKSSMKKFGEGTKELTDAEKEALAKKKEAQDKANELAKAQGEKAKEAREQQLEALKSLEEKYANDILDLGAKSDAEKLKLEKDRALKELDLVKLSEKEKAKAKELLLKDFQLKEEAMIASHAEKLLALNTKFDDEQKALLAVTDEQKLKLSQENASKQLESDLASMFASIPERETARKNLEETFAIQNAQLKYNREKSERQLALENEMNDLKTSSERKRAIILEQEKIALEDATLTEQQKAQIHLTAVNTIAQMDSDKKTADDEEKLALIALDLENDLISFEAKKQLILDREAILLGDQTLTESEKTKIHKDSVDAQMAIDKAKYEGQQELLKATSDSLNIASDVVGKNTVAGKAMAVASALINTYQGITAGVKLGYPQAIPAVLAASVTGFKAVKSILSVKTPAGGGASASAPSGIGTPSMAMPSSNVVATSGINQLASTLTKQPPIKAFVVAKDVSTQQSMDRNIVKTATLA